jgi:hypothetical protein
MTVAEAAKTWEEGKLELERIRPAMDVAADVLKTHFRKTGRKQYQGRIGFAVTTRMQLDTAAVKRELADRLEKFQKRVEIEQLSLLKK